MSRTKSNAITHFNNAIFKQESGEIHEAITLLKNAVAIDPNLYTAHLRLGYLQHKTGFYDDAIPHLKKCGKATKNADAYYLLGHCYYLKHQHGAARKAFERALKINKNLHDAQAGIGTILFDNGEILQANELIFPYIKKRKYNTNIASLYSRICVKNNTCDTLLDYLNDWLQDIDLSDKETTVSQIHFLIGDIHDRQKHYNKAFQSYIEANKSINNNYNPYEHEKAITNIVDIYSPAFFMGCITSENNSKQPIFVVGMPRSGTSLIEQIISSHSQVFGAGELPTISDIKNEITASTNSPFPDCMKLAGSELLNEKAETYLTEINTLSGNTKYVVDKMPHNFLYVGLIFQLFPNCKIIHCKRDPLDTCLSIYSKSFNVTHSYSSDFDNLAHHYFNYQRIMKHWQCVLSNSIYEVEYENIIADAKNEVQKLIQFCGLEWEETCMDFYQTKRHVVTASKDQVNKPLYSSSVARWRNYLPDIQPLVDTLKKYGIHSKNYSTD